MQHTHVLHEHVVIVSARTTNVPYIPWPQRLTIEHLGDPLDGIVHVIADFGFQDRTDIPEALHRASIQDPTSGIEHETASYFLSRISLHRTRRPGMSTWRKQLFITLAHNAANQAEHLCLPQDRTITVGSNVDL